jgi:hypothetical protein
MHPQQPYPQQPYQQAPGYGAPGNYPPPPPQAPTNGLGTTALILGILAILLAFVPILGFVSYPLAILGIVFGLVGLRRVSRRVAITYKASSTSGRPVIVTYTQGNNGSGSQTQAKSPWSVDTTVTGSVAILSVSSSFDINGKQDGVTCSIIDRDTGKTLVTNSVPASGGASVTCTASNLSAK